MWRQTRSTIWCPRLAHPLLSEFDWVNVNDPGFPFVGVIEHTNLDQTDPSGRRHIVFRVTYLSPIQCSARRPIYIVRFTLPHLQRMFPGLDPECILATASALCPTFGAP